MPRGKLVGVEEEKIEGVTSISNSEFHHLQRRTSDVEFRPYKCWIPYFLYIGVLSDILCFSKKIGTVKKSNFFFFHKKKLFT